MKRIIKGISVGLGILSLFSLAYYVQIRFLSDKTLEKQPNIRYTSTPTVFIHGYQGSSFSFGSLLYQLERKNIAKRELVIVVKPDGQLHVEGNLTQQAENPTIMVLFAKDSQSEVTQSKWIAKVMTYLYQQGVRRVNCVAHSMGGVSLLRYLLEYTGPKQPVTQKIVTAGAPFNDLEIAEDTKEIFAYELTEEGPKGKTPIYQYFDQTMGKLPANLQVLNFAGDLADGTKSDGSVSTHSVFSLRYLLKNHTKSYQEETITGSSGGHSRMIHSLLFEQKLVQFLWEK